MLAYCKETSQKSDSYSKQKSDWKQVAIYISYRHEFHDIFQDLEFCHHISHCSSIKCIQ